MSRKHSKWRVLLGLLGGVALPTSAQAATWFVKPSGTGDGTDGWSDACSLQTALAGAAEGDEIWVAKANSPTDPPVPYNPSVIFPSGTDVRRKTFHIPRGVGVYGGFLGNEGARTDRNPEANETILDGTLVTDGTYAYHVVYFDNALVTDTKLSGFTIRNGRADHETDADDSRGGGIFMTAVTSGGPALDRLVIRDNIARAGGAGIYNGGLDIAYLANCRFEYNTVTQDPAGLGGAVLIQNKGYAIFSNCIFYHNSSGGAGGAIAATTEPSHTGGVVVNCTFHDNEAGGNADNKTGGAIYSEVQYITVFNSIAWENTSPQFDGPLTDPSQPVTNFIVAQYSDVQDGDWPTYSATNKDEDPRFRDRDNGQLSLMRCSPCIDWGIYYVGYVQPDRTDIDDDADDDELMPWDFKKAERVVDFVNNGHDYDIDMGAYEECPGDVDGDGDVDYVDLLILLSCFGTTDCANPNPLCCRADLEGDCATESSVDIEDLALLLSRYGLSCPPGDPPPAPLTGGVTTTVTAYDTSSYTGGGFYGESQHFCFDLFCTIAESADDWIGTGVAVTAANGATFRLVPNAGNPPTPGSTIPEKYATFFSQPYAVDNSSRFTAPLSNGAIAGKYNSGTGAHTYTSTAINAAWYDNASSNDGPAAVFRLVINVKTVTGADTSGGFGSVYFVATGGTPGAGDIKVADMTFDVEHKYADSGSTVTTGSFYVTD